MPETLNSPIQKHPTFVGYDFEGMRVSEVYDFSASDGQPVLYLVPTEYAVFVYDEAGVKHKHYKNDYSIFKVRDGRIWKYFRNKKAAEFAGFKFSFRMNAFMKEDHPDFYGTETILRYHSSARTDYTIPEDNWKVGCEVEKEDSRYNRNESVWKLFSETGWAKETDGSLDANGFELISPILPLYDRARLKKALRPVKKYLNAEHSRNCGGHINLSCKGKTSKEVLASLKAGAALLYAIYQPRMNNRFCQVREWRNYERMPDKYSAFYIKNDIVCEIRLMPAVKSLKNLMWRLDLIRWLVSINEKDFVKKILSLQNRNSYLSCHLRQVYTEDKIRDIAQRAIKHHQKWVAPLTVTEKAKLEAVGYVVDPNRIVEDVIGLNEVEG